MKRIIALLLTAVLAPGLLAGCGASEKPATDEQITVELTENAEYITVFDPVG